MEKRRSSNMRELRLASRMALTLCDVLVLVDLGQHGLKYIHFFSVADAGHEVLSCLNDFIGDFVVGF